MYYFPLNLAVVRISSTMHVTAVTDTKTLLFFNLVRRHALICAVFKEFSSVTEQTDRVPTETGWPS